MGAMREPASRGHAPSPEAIRPSMPKPAENRPQMTRLPNRTKYFIKDTARRPFSPFSHSSLSPARRPLRRRPRVFCRFLPQTSNLALRLWAFHKVPRTPSSFDFSAIQGKFGFLRLDGFQEKQPLASPSRLFSAALVFAGARCLFEGGTLPDRLHPPPPPDDFPRLAGVFRVTSALDPPPPAPAQPITF
ncbi:uncharacterized protein VTP21DRAFT_11219 [Calcarisporiella thermophila]|uniref:uncharacterized protein n=1 Tax=Calcarisporiella thermophila TaxID=911321 RepID=UPI0037429F78